MGIVRFPDHSEEFRRCLAECDVTAIRILWKHLAPNMPSPESDADALTCIHLARTAAERIPFRLRAYSHRWLTERKLPSQLPDELKPKAERMYPRVVSAVGVCVATWNNRKTDYHHAVSTALCNVVENDYADGIEDPAIIKAHMKVVHDRMRKQR